MAYFTTLLRYIHQNPVKAGIVEHVKDYEYSSWCEYDGTVEPLFQICNTQTVLNRIPLPQLEEWINEPLPEDVYCLDIEGSSRRRPSDDQIWNLIKEKTGVTNNSAFQQLDNGTRQQIFLELKDIGASLRQLERLTGIGKLSEQRAQCHARMSIVESRRKSTKLRESSTVFGILESSSPNRFLSGQATLCSSTCILTPPRDSDLSLLSFNCNRHWQGSHPPYLEFR